MGLFDSGKIVQVSATAYNLAGDEVDRPNYLQSLVVRNVLSGTKDSISQTLQNGYLKGPGIKFRSFYRWAQDNYKLIGMPQGQLVGNSSLNTEDLAQHIPTDPGKKVWVQRVTVGRADYTIWVDRWLMLNQPTRYNENWSAEYFKATEAVAEVPPILDQPAVPAKPAEDQKIVIKFPNGDTFTFNPEGYNVSSDYIYGYYTEMTEAIVGTIQPGSLVQIGNAKLPDTNGWSRTEESVGAATPVKLKTVITTVITYADGRPSETKVDETETNGTTRTKTVKYVKKSYTGQGTNPTRDTLNSKTEYMTQYEGQKVFQEVGTSESSIGEGASKITTTTMATSDRVVPDNSYKIDVQNTVETEWGPLRVFIYRVGSGNSELDALIEPADNLGEFYPVMPARIDNQPMNDKFGNLYEEVKKAYKKATGQKLDKLIDKIEDNKDVKDIDYAFVVFGVSLNVKENSCKRYLFNFFVRLMDNQIGGPEAYKIWEEADEQYRVQYAAWKKWKDDQDDEKKPLYGHPNPGQPQAVSTPGNQLRIFTTDIFKVKYDTGLTWGYVKRVKVRGKAKVANKDLTRGQLMFEHTGFTQFGHDIYTGEFTKIPDIPLRASTLRLYWQREDYEYEYLEIIDLQYHNNVYDGHIVSVDGTTAINDDDESPFIVPLHYDTYKETSLLHATQMSTACVFLVLNSFKVKKKKWYEKGIFKILIVVAIAILSVVFTGGAGIGILGANLAIGASFGLTGLTAAIVGSVVNALAGLVVSTLLEKATAKLGIFGQIIGAIVGMALGGGLSMGPGGLSVNWGSILRVDNLMKMTDALAKGYVQSIGANIAEMGQELAKLQEDAKNLSSQVGDLMAKNFGTGNGRIDPLMFLSNSGRNYIESSDTFLSRTQMTGGDIASMSMDMLTNFAEFSTKLPDAFS